VTTTRTTKGLVFRLPNGETESLHFTQSDWRATRNFRAQLRRNGLEYPGDYTRFKGRKGKPQSSTIEKLTEALADIDHAPEAAVTTVELCSRTGLNSPAVVRGMQELGWWHDYRKPGARLTLVWHPPFDPTEVIEEIEPEPPTLSIVPDAPEREFIDSVDSFAVPLDELDPSTTISQLLALYRATGLACELRAWRIDT